MKLIIPKAIEDMIYAYCMSVDSEIAGMGKVKLEDGDLIVEDIMIVEQEVTGATADLKPEALAKWQSDLVRAGGSPKSWRLWWHSHDRMSAFFSDRDTRTIDGSTDADWMVSLVVNKRRERKARLDIYKPFRVKIETLDIEIDGEPAYTVPADIAMEVAEKVKRAVETYRMGYAHGSTDTTLNQGGGLGYTIDDVVSLHLYCPMAYTNGGTRHCYAPYGINQEGVYADCTTKAFRKTYGKKLRKAVGKAIKLDKHYEEAKKETEIEQAEREYTSIEVSGFIKEINSQIDYLEGRGQGDSIEALNLTSELADWYYYLADLETDPFRKSAIRDEADILDSLARDMHPAEQQKLLS